MRKLLHTPRATRRAFLAAAAALAATPLLPAESEVPASALAADPLRPQCHLLPPRGWMNDPNGPIVWNGKTHLFYQVNPTGGADWGDISWGHAVSSDMIHWQNLPVAMEPQPGGIDSFGVFSGCCIRDSGKDGDRCLAFYTAVAPAPTPDKITLVGSLQREQQNVAVSTDADLRHWTRQTTPVIGDAPLDHIAGFRDPCVWKQDSHWYMALGSGQVDGDGCVLLYKATIPDGSKADWTYQHKLISAPGNGKRTPDTVDAGTMWECPDFFALDGHQVLLYSTERKVYWITGTLKPDMTFEPKQRGMLDTGAFYAPKSMTDAQGQRILWGWIPEKRDKAAYIASGWSGCMALPRLLHVDAQGHLRMSVPTAANALLTGPKRSVAGADIAAGHFAALALKIEASLPTTDTGFVVAQTGSAKGTGQDAELLRIHRTSADEVEINGEKIPAPSPTHDDLTVWIDGSVIEIFFSDRAAHTVRSYPKLRGNAGLSVLVAGDKTIVSVQQLKPISPNRLTS